MKEKQLTNLLAIVVRSVAVEEIYLDRALRDLFVERKVVDPDIRRALSLYAPFIFRNWYSLGGGKGESIINIVRKALEVPAEELELFSSKITTPDFPEWFIELAKTEVDGSWRDELMAFNHRPARYIRANTLKIDMPNLIQELRKQAVMVRPVSGYPDAIEVIGGKELFGTVPFKSGLLEIQDISSQQVAPFLLRSYKGSGLVVDACAGNGGKSLHLGALMGNRGRIISMDLYQQKLDELKRRALKNGVTNIETRLLDTTKVVKRLYDKVDHLLLDVPCSGTGVFRRNPESKLRMTLESIENVKKQQADILSRYSKMVRPGGELVYSTCSILKSENRGQVDAFLAVRPEFSLIEDCSISATSGGDGFYMARLKREKVEVAKSEKREVKGEPTIKPLS